jgi:RNA polymerase sigma-70 factor (ECF subfamily)
VTDVRFVDFNGQPGALGLGPHGDPVVVLSLDIADGVVQTVRAISNPEKLRHLGSFLDLRHPRS